MVLLQLGPVSLEGFEVPGRVRFGGAQSLAVHKLPGGVRVIDAMGRDDGDLVWSGILSGQDAGDRARLLDAMRAAGDVLALTWDEFYYSVLVSTLRLDYRNPWWIEYMITCKVLRDEAQTDQAIVIPVVSAIAADLAVAGSYIDVTAAVAATSATGALIVGTEASATAAGSLEFLQNSVSQGIVSAEANLGSNDLATEVSVCSMLAQLTFAQGFVSRAASNLAGATD